MFTRLKNWFLSIVRAALAEERAITSAMVGTVRQDFIKMEVRMVRDLTVLKQDLLKELMKPEHVAEAIKSSIEAESHKMVSAATTSAHNAIQDIRAGVGRKRCEFCHLVKDAWQLVEGKVKCADCIIRKAL